MTMKFSTAQNLCGAWLCPKIKAREIGAILLDQTVLAGLGNYLRAEILFLCRLDPFRRVETLHERELKQLCAAIARVVRVAYDNGGATVPDEQRQRMREDETLVYKAGPRIRVRAIMVFRRTNLPCLACGDTIRQLRQTTRVAAEDDDGGDKTRIIYFCPSCQDVAVPLKPSRKKKPRAEK